MSNPASQSRHLRKVHRQRARKLRKRGHCVWWEPTMQSLVWDRSEVMDDATRYALGAA